MSANASKMLECFFDIEKGVIERDLHRAEMNFREIAEDIESLQASGGTEDSPEAEAQRAHLGLIHAHELCRRNELAPELQAFFASFAGGSIAQAAEFIAPDKDKCAEILAKMEDIRKREGLADGEFWVMAGDGPQDYHELDNEISQLTGRIWDTVFTSVLRRYRMDRQADLYENDPDTFETYREIGNRVIMPTDETISGFRELMDNNFKAKHGETAFDRFTARLKELQNTYRKPS